MVARATAGPGRLDRVALPDRYKVLHHIADGGMASVWCTRDRTLQRTVAIKLLAERYVHDSPAVKRFEREARAAARVCTHRNIATIYDVGFASSADGGEVPFIAMEYLDGGSVRDALGERSVDAELALRWLRETASALDHAHRRGVIHRDIKPANLLLDENRSVRVADFGIARLGDEATITNVGQVLGTAAYLPPEQALGQPATEAGDRYSLAVVAYELLTGTKPFGDDRLALLSRSRAALRPPPASTRNPGLPGAVDGVLARGLASVPSRRWTSASEFARRITAATNGICEVPTAPEVAFGVVPGAVPGAPAPVAPAQTAQTAQLDSPTAETPLPPHYRRFRTAGFAGPVGMVALVVIAALALAAGIATGAGTRSSTAGNHGRTAAAKVHHTTHRTAKTVQHTSMARTVTQTPATQPTPGPASTPGPGPAGPPGQLKHHHRHGHGGPFGGGGSSNGD